MKEQYENRTARILWKWLTGDKFPKYSVSFMINFDNSGKETGVISKSFSFSRASLFWYAKNKMDVRITFYEHTITKTKNLRTKKIIKKHDCVENEIKSYEDFLKYTVSPFTGKPFTSKNLSMFPDNDFVLDLIELCGEY